MEKEIRRYIKILLGILAIFIFSFLTFNTAKADTTNQLNANTENQNTTYNVITKSFDWGPGNQKIVVKFPQKVKSVSQNTFKVKATKTYTEDTTTKKAVQTNSKTALKIQNNQNKQSNGSQNLVQKTDTKAIKVTKAYLSDQSGNIKNVSSNYATLELYVHPDNIFTNPFTTDPLTGMNKNVGIKYNINQVKPLKTIQGQTISKLKLTPVQLRKTLIPQIAAYKKNTFSYNDKNYGQVKLNYANYRAKGLTKRPLIIMLHGAGEGGTDLNVTLLGNKVSALSSSRIQSYFKQGANVLVPQAPTMWMDNGTGQNTTNGNSKYANALLALIKNYVRSNPEIDQSRIYVGGLSNGGYMTLKMLLKDPKYFAAGFPISESYQSKWLKNKQLEKIKNKPMWFVQSINDDTVPFKKTTKPTVNRLRKMGALDVNLTAYQHVIDTTGAVKDKYGNPYHYGEHWSWIYVYNDDVANANGTHLFKWLASKHN